MAVATIGAAGSVFAAAPTWVVLVTVSLVWLPILAGRCGAAAGIALVVVLECWMLLMVMLVTAVLMVPMVPMVVIVWTMFGLAGSVALARGAPAVRWSPTATTVVLASTVGGFVWLATQGLASVVPGASRVSWVMRGDSANNLVFARQVVYDSGISVGAGENPVPFPAALIAVVMDAGRSGIRLGDLARHDVGSFAQVWSLCIIITCVLAGLVAASIAKYSTNNRATLAVAGAVGSLVPLSWFVTGYSLEFGFFSTHVALPIVFAAIILFLSSPRHPASMLGMLAVCATLLLAVWSPLVLVPAVLGAIVLVRFRRRLLATRGRMLAIVLVGMLQLVVYGSVVVVPGFLRNATSLAADGGIIEFPRLGIVIAVLVVGTVVSALLAFRRAGHPVPLAVAGTVVALAAGIGALLFASRASAELWGYYPMKLLWMSATILIVLLVGTATAVLERVVARRWLHQAGLGIVGLGLVVLVAYAPAASPAPHLNPVDQVLSGRSLGVADQVAERVFSLANPRRSHFLWNSGYEFEQPVNLWVTQLGVDTLEGNDDLRYAAYGLYNSDDVNELCRIVGLLGGDTVVHTAESNLVAQVSAACPGRGIVVREE